MNILNLPSWAVLETRESDHDYHITVQLTYPPSHCPHCGVVANLQGYGGKEQLFLDHLTSEDCERIERALGL